MFLRFTVLISFAILLLGCQQTSDDSIFLTTKDENVYAKYHIKSMIQYSHDLAFIEPENIGRIIQITSFNRKGEVVKIIRYDKYGNVCFTENIDPNKGKGKNKLDVPDLFEDSITVTNINPQGKPIEKIFNTYNDHKQIISTIKKDQNGLMSEKITFKYYPNGLIMKDIYWNVDLDKPEQIINYKYEYFK